MTIEQNKALVRRLYAVIDANDLTAVPEIFAPTWVNHDPSLPPLAGHDGARQLIRLLKSAFPDYQTTVEALVAEGDIVAARLTHTATHLGEFMGIPPTGRQASVSASGIIRIAEGRVVENHIIFDALGLLRQLGLVPEPA